MIQVTIAEAKERLPMLLAEAQAGHGVEIRGDVGATFRLVPNRPRTPTGIPRVGSCKGIIMIGDDFDAPLEELREYME